ncbi:MAG: diguanylate cyclase, partial [Rhodocyclaceae bacterium]|nr:diguanylate cyclase [Rhodocyclaceae bacterium]
MQQAMARARRDNSLLALCYLDLDGFKPINDTLGHDVGDRLLEEIATRLAGSMRAGDTVARLGGDEFALLIVDLDDMTELSHICERVLHLLAEPMAIGEHTLAISASMGVTLFPQDGVDADTLLRHADHAMYSAKQAGRNRYHLFDADQDRRLRDHQEIVGSLERALQQEEFELHYQPKVSLRTGQVIGVEALLRWRHPKRGVLEPREFLAFIENCDLALPVGRWVIDQALGQLELWRQQGIDLEMNINISPRHLQHPDFLADLKSALAVHPTAPARRLELEIVETAALHD